MYIYGKNAVLESIKKENIKKVFLYKNFNDKGILRKIGNYDIYYKEKYDILKLEGKS